MKKVLHVAIITVVSTVLSITGYAAPERSSLPEELVEDVSALVDADKDRLVTMFKDLHQNPSWDSWRFARQA